MLHHFLRAALGSADSLRILVAVVTFPDAESEADLLEIVDAANALRFAFGGGEGGQQHGRENGDDRDHDEQLDERERFLLLDDFFHTTLFVGCSCFVRDRPRCLLESCALSTEFLKFF